MAAFAFEKPVTHLAFDTAAELRVDRGRLPPVVSASPASIEKGAKIVK